MAQRLDIDHVRFSTATLGGYDMEQVDTFLEDAKARLAALEIAVRSGTPLPPELPLPRFRWALLQESYLASDVRQFVAAIRAEEDELRRTPPYAALGHGFAGRDERAGRDSQIRRLD